MDRPDPLATAKRALAERYPDAELAFLAGSVVRGDATATSDLDLVVVFGRLDRAYRQSFTLDGWPIEAFMHDPQTLRYFMEEVDGARGVPSMPAMISEGIAIPEVTALARNLQSCANAVLDAGPPPLSPEELDSRRYAITDMAEDLVDPRSHIEARATGIQLYPLMAEFALRARGEWSATGKTLPRRLSDADPDLAQAFEAAFDALFEGRDTGPVIALAERILQPHGGRRRDGYEAFAPADWRKEWETPCA